MKSGLVISGILLLILAPLMVVCGTVYTLLLPNRYESQVQIVITEPNPAIDPFAALSENAVQAYNPVYLKTQFQVIQSRPVLSAVVNRLNLPEKWGRGGELLPMDVAVQILQNSIRVLQVPDTSVVIISVRRPNPDEAAFVANEVAATYRDYRLEASNKESRKILAALEDALKEQAQRVLDAEQSLLEIPDRYEITTRDDDGDGGERENSASIRLAMDNLENERLIYNELSSRFRREMIKLNIPRNPAEIIDNAEPNRRPVSPDLFMNLLAAVIAGGIAGVAGLVLLLIGMKKKPDLSTV